MVEELKKRVSVLNNMNANLIKQQNQATEMEAQAKVCLQFASDR
jgi:hypothetical protein